MLFLPIGMKKPIHIQGTYIHDNEIQNIINFVRTQQEAFYDDSFMKLEKVKVDATNEVNNDDKLYEQIVDFVIKTQKASASLLQRKFKIGYNMAATMIDKLEEDGIIGPATGSSKPRDVLVTYSNEDE